MVFNVNFNLVAHLQVWIVAEFRCGNDAIALVTDVYYDFFFVDSSYNAFYNLVFLDFVQGVVVSFCKLVFVATNGFTVFKLLPVEV